LVVVSVLWFSYAKYARLADEKLAHGLFPKSSLLYAAPQVIGVGDSGTPLQMAARLRESGYSEDARSNTNGWYHLRPDAVEIFPGPQAYMVGQPGVVRYQDDKIESIIDLTDNTPRTEYTLDPQLLSSLFAKNREKRRLVRYEDMPPVLVHALISAEDKRFFQHSGFDPIRMTRAFFVDLKEHRKAEGASTLTQQLAWMMWLDHRKTFGRKFAELMISIHLERKLTSPN
jgi:penicillin-binding protein 1B